MTAPKTLKKMADNVGGIVVNLSFGSRKGYCIIDSERNELLTCEPVNYSNGDRWLISNKCNQSYSYCKSIRNVHNQSIKPGYTGFRLK